MEEGRIQSIIKITPMCQCTKDKNNLSTVNNELIEPVKAGGQRSVCCNV